MKIKDIMPADRFGKWTVLGTAQKIHGKWQVYCACDCGTVTFVDANLLIRGKSTCCGCAHWIVRDREDLPHGISATRLYKIWKGMIDRCCNPENGHYDRYGGRGITVCDEWRNDIVAFYDWAMANGYQSYLTLDRTDNNKGYSPENCRWATPEQQSNNMRRNHHLTFNGKTQTVTQWAKELDIPRSTIYNRLSKGWDDVKALTYDGQPSRPNKRKEVKPLCGLRHANS